MASKDKVLQQQSDDDDGVFNTDTFSVIDNYRAKLVKGQLVDSVLEIARGRIAAKEQAKAALEMDEEEGFEAQAASAGEEVEVVVDDDGKEEKEEMATQADADGDDYERERQFHDDSEFFQTSVAVWLPYDHFLKQTRSPDRSFKDYLNGDYVKSWQTLSVCLLGDNPAVSKPEARKCIEAALVKVVDLCLSDTGLLKAEQIAKLPSNDSVLQLLSVFSILTRHLDRDTILPWLDRLSGVRNDVSRRLVDARSSESGDSEVARVLFNVDQPTHRLRAGVVQDLIAAALHPTYLEEAADPVATNFRRLRNQSMPAMREIIDNVSSSALDDPELALLINVYESLDESSLPDMRHPLMDAVTVHLAGKYKVSGISPIDKRSVKVFGEVALKTRQQLLSDTMLQGLDLCTLFGALPWRARFPFDAENAFGGVSVALLCLRRLHDSMVRVDNGQLVFLRSACAILQLALIECDYRHYITQDNPDDKQIAEAQDTAKLATGEIHQFMLANHTFEAFAELAGVRGFLAPPETKSRPRADSDTEMANTETKSSPTTTSPIAFALGKTEAWLSGISDRELCEMLMLRLRLASYLLAVLRVTELQAKASKQAVRSLWPFSGVTASSFQDVLMESERCCAEAERVVAECQKARARS